MKPSPSVLKAFDLLYKPIEEYTTRTATGGVVTLAASCIMLLLFLSETRLFLTTRTEHELVVDTTRGETIQINVRGVRSLSGGVPFPALNPAQLDITFPRLSCAVLSLDVMDVSGEEQARSRVSRRRRVTR